MTRVCILATVAVMLATSPASAACVLSHCQEGSSTRTYVRNNWESGRQIVGDLYDPGHDRRIQIRDTSRRILFYVEADGRIINTRRQEVLSVEALR